MYNSDVRVATTASPSYQSQTNVGQYGWTGADQGHYNQLIQYVEEVRSTWNTIQNILDTLERVSNDTEKIELALKFVYDSTNEIREMKSEMDSILTRAEHYLGQMNVVEESVQFIQRDMTPKYEDFLVKYQDFLDKLP